MECQSTSRPNSRFTSTSSYINSPDTILQDAFTGLVEGDFNTRWQAAKVLKTYGEGVHASLIAIAQSNLEDPDLQGFIVGILGGSPTPDTLLFLVTLLNQTRDEELRETIVLTLGKLGPSQVDALLDLADQPELQPSVLRALEQINHPCTIDGLLKFVNHDSSDLRASALEALGQFHGDLITTLLRRGLKDSASKVRVVSVKALGLRQSSEVNEGLIAEVSALLYDIHPQVCRMAARTLGRFDHPVALESVWHRLIEQPAPISLIQSLIRALGWSGHPTGVTFLLKLVTLISSHSSEMGAPWPLELVNDLIQVIANLEGSHLAETIESNLTSLLASQQAPFNQVQVQQRLIMAIARLQQDRSIIPLIKALSIQDDRIRFHIISALKQINADLSHETLADYVQDSALEPELKAGIAIALREW